mgnify:CR=1 FL=1
MLRGAQTRLISASFLGFFKQSIWVSGYKRKNSNKHYWVTASGEVPFETQNFSIWLNKQPDFSGECLMLDEPPTLRLDDASCGKTDRYVACEKPAVLLSANTV